MVQCGYKETGSTVNTFCEGYVADQDDIETLETLLEEAQEAHATAIELFMMGEEGQLPSEAEKAVEKAQAALDAVVVKF